MKIIVFQNNVFLKDRITLAQHNGWLPEKLDVEYRPSTQLEQFRVGFMGIDKNNLLNHFRSKTHQILLIEDRFLAHRFSASSENVLAISTISEDNIEVSFVKICEHILWWMLKESHVCQEASCATAQSAVAFCPDCQKIFSHNGLGNELISYSALTELRKIAHKELLRLFNLNIVETIRAIPLQFGYSYLNVLASNKIIDFNLRDGTSIRQWLCKTSNDISAQKKEITNKYQSCPDASPPFPFFIASRRWNSWTPSQPRQTTKIYHNKNGGGYVVSDGEKIVVIDPGYGFLDIFDQYHHMSVNEIDAILITHDHPDHASELQNILGLRFVYKHLSHSPLQVFLNPSTYYIYERILSYHQEIIDTTSPHKIEPGDNFTVGNMQFNTIGMYHKEIFHCLSEENFAKQNVGKSMALGVKINILYNNYNYNIIIPGDTSFPNDLNEVEALASFYGNPDIASVHLGSLEKFFEHKNDECASNIVYAGGHLGLNGTINFLNLVSPKVAIISEFGEELDAGNMRLSLTELVGDLLIDKRTKVIPSDVKLFLALHNGKTYLKCDCNDYIPVEKVYFSRDRNNFIAYSFHPGCDSKLAHFSHRDFL